MNAGQKSCWANGRVVLLALGALLALALSGCGSVGPAPVYDTYGPAPPGYYRIRSGDTLYKIAVRYKVGYEVLARWNNLGSPYRIFAGALLRVEPPEGKAGVPSHHDTKPAETTKKATKHPSTASRATKQSSAKSKATKQSDSKNQATVKVSAQKSQRNRPTATKVASGLRWRWPLEGKVVQKFRSGDRTRQGIRIAGRPGQKVVAAEGGTIVYSGSGLKGYGNLIIVKHDNSYLSAYGFNRRLLATEGARVKRGQEIAEVGQAPGGGYRLHFEIRRSGTAVDPLKYLP